MEKDLEQLRGQEDGDLAEFTNRILSNYNVAVRSNSNDQELLFQSCMTNFITGNLTGKRNTPQALNKQQEQLIITAKLCITKK